MIKLRAILVIMTFWICAYTGLVIFNHGMDLFSVFFGDIAKMTWPGQFNTDFTCLLLLAGLWVSWRHKFSPMGIILGVVQFVGGILFLAPYLLFLSFKEQGNVVKILVGRNQA